jgi:hypothetical protein
VPLVVTFKDEAAPRVVVESHEVPCQYQVSPLGITPLFVRVTVSHLGPLLVIAAGTSGTLEMVTLKVAVIAVASVIVTV